VITPRLALPTCSTRDAARRLGVSVRTVQLWVEEGRLQAWKTPGGHRRIRLDSVLALAGESQEGPQDQGWRLLLLQEGARGQALEQALVSALPDCQLVRAQNGFDALLHIGQEAPDILISDLGLSGMDFFAMVQSLSQHPRCRAMRLIVLVASDADARGARQRLPDDVVLLREPLEENELAALVKAFRRSWLRGGGQDER
jgi:excisionase family DNA binding protein